MKDNKVSVQFLGCGDNFGAGGRLQTCILLRTGNTSTLIDCGNTALIGMNRFGVNPNSIDNIVVTHLHGDHFGGIPILILYGQFKKRESPLSIIGPEGTKERIEKAMDVFYPGSTGVKRRFDIMIKELQLYEECILTDLRIKSFPAIHHSGAPAFIIRISAANKIISYTGDTEWTESIIHASENTDLLIAESYFFEKKIKYHLDYATLLENRDRIKTKRIVLTHLGEDMFTNLNNVMLEYAEDGMKIYL